MFWPLDKDVQALFFVQNAPCPKSALTPETFRLVPGLLIFVFLSRRGQV